jgi:hypothetical protein
MLIRKNTKLFKTIVEIVTNCQNRADRNKLIRLYVTRAGHSIKDRIGIEGIKGEADVFYDMSYQAVLSNLKSADHQLHQSDEIAGIYFFHTNSNKAWDQTPFEFDVAVKNEFASLPELPAVRKKEKVQPFTFPAPKTKTESRPIKKESAQAREVAKTVGAEPRQPNYMLRHSIRFTDLEKVVYRPAQLTKKDVLDYYNQVAAYMLPYLKDRPQVIRLRTHTGNVQEYSTLQQLKRDGADLPDWLQTHSVSEGEETSNFLLCNDKEHLLFYVEMGCYHFSIPV